MQETEAWVRQKNLESQTNKHTIVHIIGIRSDLVLVSLIHKHYTSRSKKKKKIMPELSSEPNDDSGP
jgi:hypothetical protein